MAQAKAIEALQPFLARSQTVASEREAVDLVRQAIAHPHTFVFTELLQAPAIARLAASPDYAADHTLLQIFSHGTYQDYLGTGDRFSENQSTSTTTTTTIIPHDTTGLPPLDDQQRTKLRQLSLLTLCRDRRQLAYATLQQNLGLSSPKDLESLVVSAIYAGLLDATLDPHAQQVNLYHVAPLRDVPPHASALSALANTFVDVRRRCDQALGTLQAEIDAIQHAAQQRKNQADHLRQVVHSEMNTSRAQQKPPHSLSTTAPPYGSLSAQATHAYDPSTLANPGSDYPSTITSQTSSFPMTSIRDAVDYMADPSATFDPSFPYPNRSPLGVSTDLSPPHLPTYAPEDSLEPTSSGSTRQTKRGPDRSPVVMSLDGMMDVDHGLEETEKKRSKI